MENKEPSVEVGKILTLKFAAAMRKRYAWSDDTNVDLKAGAQLARLALQTCKNDQQTALAIAQKVVIVTTKLTEFQEALGKVANESDWEAFLKRVTQWDDAIRAKHNDTEVKVNKSRWNLTTDFCTLSTKSGAKCNKQTVYKRMRQTRAGDEMEKNEYHCTSCQGDLP
jgi:hypothetical protein